MKFGIKEVRYIIKTNIEGKVLTESVDYYVYRRVFFIKLYLMLRPRRGWEVSNEVSVQYSPQKWASSFDTRKEAEAVIKAIKENPDKFIRYNNQKK